MKCYSSSTFHKRRKTMLDKNPVALVTGSSRGIGRAIAVRLAKDGYTVILHSRKPADPSDPDKGIGEVKREIEAQGGTAVLCSGDLGTTEGRARIIGFIEKEIGRVDLLVNNAGIEPPPKDMLELTEEDIRHVMEVNLFGPYHITRQIAARMIQWKAAGVIQKGRIVFITSVQAYRSTPFGSGYGMSKASLHMAVQQFAERLAGEDIPVIEIRPGVIPTDMSLLHKENIDSKLAEGWAPARRWGTLEEMAEMVSCAGRGVFDYSTGAAIDISGGMNIFGL
jgi:NAD(P)-dependent dehydrogenase (short-subunit alcohol dehydrogenase family)